MRVVDVSISGVFSSPFISLKEMPSEAVMAMLEPEKGSGPSMIRVFRMFKLAALEVSEDVINGLSFGDMTDAIDQWHTASSDDDDYEMDVSVPEAWDTAWG